MKPKPAAPAVDTSDEIVGLVRILHQTQERLMELTGGQVDAVLHQGGQSYLLHEAQGKLQESEKNQRRLATTMLAILNALPAHICLLDAHGQILSVNDSWRQFARFHNWPDPEHAAERNYLEICDRAAGPSAEDAHRTAAGIRAVLSGQSKDFELEYPCETPDRKLWFQVIVSPVSEHRPGGAVVMHIDITERKAAEESVRQSEERFRNMFTAAATGIAISTPEGRFLEVNEAYCRMLGYTEEELQARDFPSITHPDDLPQNIKLRDEVLAGRRKSFTMEKRYIRKNGEIVWTRHSVSPSHAIDGQISGFIIVAEDFTERKAAEEALRATAGNLAVSQSIAHLGSWEMILENLENLRANPLTWSDELYRIMGYEPQSVEVTPELYLSHVLGDDHDLIEERLKEVIRHNQESSHHYPIVRADGEIRIVQTAAQVIQRDKNGRALKLIGTVHDVTDARKNEDLLLAETALLEAQLNSTLDGIIIVDPDGKRILQNQRVVDIWKIPEEFAYETYHQRRFEWITSQVRNKEPFLEKVRHLYANPDEISRDELELIDGRFIDRYSAPVRGSDGKYYGRIWVYRDITDRKAAERKAVEQMELITMAGQIAKLGAWTAQYPGPQLVWSDEVYHIHEVEPGFDLTPESALHFFIPESRQKLEAAIASRQPYDLELELITGKGNKRTVRMKSALKIGDDERYTIYGICQDITERKQQEARTRRLVDSNVQGVIFWTAEGDIKYANDAFLHLVGCTRDDLQAGRVNWRAMTPPEYAAADEQALREVMEKGVCTPYQKEYIGMNGRRIPVLLGSAAFDDAPNEGVCFVLDLSDQKRLEQQFLRAQRMESIGTLAGGIAHDLNNILAPIMMAVQVLKMHTTEPQMKTMLETIEVSSKRGADIVRQVLSFARGLQGERVEVQPVHLLKDIETIIRDTFPKNIRRDLHFAEDAWTILGDPTQLHQILLNLCVNARDAMPEGGNLSITVENAHLDNQYVAMNIQAKPGRYVIINVTDTGEGIPADIIDKIFDPFFTTKEVGKGTGLGLSTVMAIVKSHGGFVNVYSEVGRGSSFRIYLPATETSAKKQRETSSLAALPRGNGERILIVDDETSILSITSQTLDAFGYKSMTANDGAEAIAIYAQHRNKIAVILTDMAMPVMDGPATIRALLKVNPAAKIIAATGLKTEGSEAKALNAGVKHFLSKPYTASTLLKTLRMVLNEPKRES